MIKMPISGRQLETGEIVVKIAKTTFERVPRQLLNASFEAGAESNKFEKEVWRFPSDEKNFLV